MALMALMITALDACDPIANVRVLTMEQVDSLGWQKPLDWYRDPEQAAMQVACDPIRLHFYGWNQQEDSVIRMHFPEDMSRYGFIQLEYTMGGWNQGPADWDMTTQIMVRDKQTDEWYELTRCITPYGGTFKSNWTRTYYLNVSEFAPLLAGDAELKVFYCGWDATDKRAHTATLQFDLYEEPNPYGKAVWHQKIYDSTLNGNTGYRSWAYGVAGHSIEADERLGKRTITIPAEVRQAIVRVCFTGHGQDALTGKQGKFPGRPGYKPNNVAEFDYNYYTIILNGDTVPQRGYIWEKNNDNYAQAGTYKYDRAGWGPGQPCNVQHWLLRIPADQHTVTIDMDLDEYISKNTEPNAESVAQYYVEVDIFGYR